MKTSESSQYIKFVIIHLLIGLLIYFVPFVSKLYAISIILVGYRYVVLRKNANNEALFVAAYIVGAEVFLRMTEGNLFEQFAKYGVMGILLIGMIYRGFSKNALPYWIFGLLLLPAIFLSFFTLNFDTDIRKAITFNIIGPITLMVSAIYCYQRKISFEQIKTIINMLAYPLMATLVYMYLYTPSVKDVVTNTESNFETSGGFGPNQVSTILGLGIFLFFVKIVLSSKTVLIRNINVLFFVIITFRGIVTFSRGGVITGFVMIIIVVLLLLYYTKSQAKSKVVMLVVFGLFALVGIWSYSSIQTSGLIDKRYANQDARGREKLSKLTGRERLIESEFKMFLDNPIFGIGVGKNKEYRLETTGIDAASHNEITRMLAEHGMFGLFGLIILLITPMVLYLNNQQNIFVFSFVVFWILTINHAAMRLAAPAFVYALSLLKVSFVDEKSTAISGQSTV
ncbi:O-antigen ligase family protein [Flavobacterium sp. HXWNR29]|uniref:O-antigen ligase family protein n=1 Tax=Flavobacterium odoriferum TaxID=2946604 RepID=UPI0021CAE3F1|nr:O-antigen ligase family protein [Flavobacterium sp. HXWNR29]MCU4189500.1 O-antigen ligase family protein [Flavobacterium sp. HXWNR29]